MSIEFLNESGFEGVNEEMLIDVASYAFGAMDINPDAECTITCVDLKTIEDLHVRWMDLEGPTDVMSFPMDELTPGAIAGGGRPDAADPGPAMLGDIVLCPEFALRQAEAAGHSLGHELALLTVHGCLHLLGNDHSHPGRGEGNVWPPKRAARGLVRRRSRARRFLSAQAFWPEGFP